MTDTRSAPSAPDEDEVDRDVLALTLGLSVRQITTLIKEHLDFPSVQRGKSRTFPRRKCVQWYVRFKAAEAVKRSKPATNIDQDERRRRREEAEMKMVEMDVAEREARLVSVDHVDQVVGELSDRMRSVLINIPGNYGIRLEELGVDAAKAESVLTAIIEDLTRALRATPDVDDAAADTDSPFSGDHGDGDRAGDSGELTASH